MSASRGRRASGTPAISTAGALEMAGNRRRWEMRKRKASVVGVMIAAMAMFTASCSDSRDATDVPLGDSSAPAGASSFDEVMSHALDDSVDGGASDAQVSLLQDARDNGELTLEQAREAARATVSCLEGLGFTAEVTEETVPAGLVVPGYRVQTDHGPSDDGADDPAFAASEQCERRESFWVNQVYQTQPTSIQASVDYINDTLAPELRACLESEGFDVDDDAAGVDMVRQAMNLQVEQGAVLPCFDPREVPDF